jgi:protein-tyrosine phosphatase
MDPLRVLTVCTGNTCRSPMAAALVAARFGDAGISVEVASVGTLGWSGRPATAHAVEAMHNMGLDISGHRSRRIEPTDLEVDLVLAMTRVHADSVIARDTTLRPRVFLPTELHRLLRSADRASPNITEPNIADLLHNLDALRIGSTIGRPNEEVSDPAGEPLDTYLATAQRLDKAISGFVARLRE